MRRLMWGECRGGACDRNFVRCVRGEEERGGTIFPPHMRMHALKRR